MHTDPSVHEIFEQPGLRSSVVIQKLALMLAGPLELYYQYISQDVSYYFQRMNKYW